MERIKHPVDDFFKEVLKEHQVKPSDAERQRFLDEAASLEINGKRSQLRWFLLFGGLTVATSAALILWLIDGEQQSMNSVQPALGSRHSEIRSLKSEAANQQSAAGNRRPAADPTGTLEISAYETVAISAASVPVDDSVKRISAEIPATSNAVSTEVPPPSPSVSLNDSVVSVALELPEDDTVTKPESESIPEKVKKRKRSSEWQFATSVYYSPEWMFNTLEGDKFVSNLGIEESFCFGRYILRTGIGLSIAKGTNELMVEYNDYLGSFNQLDSISFEWDAKNYHLLPTYYMSDKEVWDSLLQLDYPKVIKRYTYVQIPLILGYDIIRKDRFSLGFRAGPILSILLNSKTLTMEYDPGKDRIIRINQVTPDRIQTNWQIQGGISLSLSLSRRFGFEFEPMIKYYFNSVYEKSEAMKKPWSVGFRASFSVFY